MLIRSIVLDIDQREGIFAFKMLRFSWQASYSELGLEVSCYSSLLHGWLGPITS